MLIITSPTYGEVTIPFIQKQSEKFSSNIPTYSRDNSSNNTNDTVTSGAVIKPPVIELSGMITDNTGTTISDFINGYNVNQIRQQLISIWTSSELISILFNDTSNPLIFGSNPLAYENVTIQDMEISADETTGLLYDIDITFIQQILVNTIYNPQIINVNANSAGPASGAPNTASTNIQATSLTPQNNGTSAPNPAAAAVEQSIANLEADL